MSFVKRLLQKHLNFIYGVVLFLTFLPFMNASIALLAGLLFSMLGLRNGNVQPYISPILQISIVLMGFGMDLEKVLVVSKDGFVDTLFSVVFVMGMGYFLTKLLKIDSKVGTLISAGTAICGGSAIAAVSPVLKAENHQISFSLLVVFVLNAVALLIFPSIGHYFNMSQHAFGQWAAIAIHDTSSVVGASAIYGKEALEVATTVKLVRTLWIIPLALFIAKYQGDNTTGKLKIPWFIFYFVLAVLVAYLLPNAKESFAHLSWMGKHAMIFSLFLIGSGISFKNIKKVGLKSFILGIILWILIGVASFVYLQNFG
jgi:uncharacterized integral membrane protein (TIGR00698 family)